MLGDRYFFWKRWAKQLKMEIIIKIDELKPIVKSLNNQEISIEKACELLTDIVECRILGVEEDFWVECNVCKQHYKNHVGSTECCGSIAYIVKNGEVSNKINLLASINNQPISPIVIDLAGSGQKNNVT